MRYREIIVETPDQAKVQHRQVLPFANTPQQKYIRFGDPPKGGKSTVWNAPNFYYRDEVGKKLPGVSVFPVFYNKERNLWQFDSSELSDSGYAGLDELIYGQSEYEDVFVSGGHSDDPVTGKHHWEPPVYKKVKRENNRAMYLVIGQEADDYGTDGEPLLNKIKILDRLNVQDVVHPGYFDPDEDLYVDKHPSAFKVSEPLEEEAEMNRFYHVTFSHRVPSIKRDGLVVGKQRVWSNAFGKKQGLKAIYLFDDSSMAVRWAHKMQFDFDKPTSILVIDNPPGEILIDNHVESQMSGQKWFYTVEAVPASCIKKAIPLTLEMTRQLVKTGKVDL